MKKNAHKPPDLFVVGTDTGVGKTVISLLLMQLFYDRGYHPFYIKPFQTGCNDPYHADSDARFVYAHTTALKHQEPAASVVYCHRPPKAPYFAAREMEDTIALKPVHHLVKEKKRRYSPLVIEASGGLLVPVTKTILIIDMAKALGARPLLVARAGLGTINHTLLSIEAMRLRRLDPLGVVLVHGTEPVEKKMIEENIEAIETYGNISVGGAIHPISDFHFPEKAVYTPLKKLLFPIP